MDKNNYSAVADLESGDQRCPFCGKQYLALDYYSYTGVSGSGDAAE